MRIGGINIGNEIEKGIGVIETEERETEEERGIEKVGETGKGIEIGILGDQQVEINILEGLRVEIGVENLGNTGTEAGIVIVTEIDTVKGKYNMIYLAYFMY